MPALKDEIDKVVSESSRRLLAVAPPPIRYWLLWDVLQRDADDEMVLDASAGCATYPPRLRLLSTLREDGTWPITTARRAEEDAGPGPPYGWTYVAMLRNLDTLGDYRTSRPEGNVAASTERILGWQTDEGYVPGPWARYPLPHYNGYALRALTILGMEEDPRVARLRDWLLSEQRDDGGWSIPYLQDVRYLPEYRHMKVRDFMGLVDRGEVPRDDEAWRHEPPSCLWTTMMAVRGLVAGEGRVTDRRVLRGAEYFLDGFFKANHHPTFFRDKAHWTKLKYPTYFGSGLCALDLLTFMGFGPEDERMDRPVRWLLGARSKDGFWCQSDRPHPEKDLWITEVALSILARYSRLY